MLDSNLKLEKNLLIRTAAQPIAGQCDVNPNLGIAGKTLFTIKCSTFKDAYDDVLLYYYYERYENHENFPGNK